MKKAPPHPFSEFKFGRSCYHRKMIMKTLIKCVDLENAARPFEISQFDVKNNEKEFKTFINHYALFETMSMV